MVLIAHSRTLPDLYVPAASIDLGAVGSDMRQAHGLVSTQVEVDLQLSVAGQFRFTIPNTFHAERADFLTPRGAPVLPLLALGTRVWIRMGYGDRARQKLLFSGFITVVGTAFAEGGSPELEVSGTDATYRMTLGTSEHRFEQKKVSDAVNKVASENGFDLKFAGTPPDNLTLELEPADRSRIPRQARPELLHPGTEMGILRARRRAPGQAPFPAAPQG